MGTLQDYQLEVIGIPSDYNDREGQEDDSGLAPLRVQQDGGPKGARVCQLGPETEDAVGAGLEVVEAQRRGGHSWEGVAPGEREAVAAGGLPVAGAVGGPEEGAV